MALRLLATRISPLAARPLATPLSSSLPVAHRLASVARLCTAASKEGAAAAAEGAPAAAPDAAPEAETKADGAAAAEADGAAEDAGAEGPSVAELEAKVA